jgi:hypothetical protein
MYVFGNSGVGNSIPDTKLGEAILGLIVKGADLDHKDPGILRWIVQGREQAFKVETYDSFGETAFRLQPVKSEGKKGKG